MHHHHSCCCDDPTVPCTQICCPNGYDADDPDRDMNVLGCTRDQNDIPNTCVTGTASTVFFTNPVFGPNENPVLIVQGNLSDSATQCAEEEFSGCCGNGVSLSAEGPLSEPQANPQFRSRGVVNVSLFASTESSSLQVNYDVQSIDTQTGDVASVDYNFGVSKVLFTSTSSPITLGDFQLTGGLGGGPGITITGSGVAIPLIQQGLNGKRQVIGANFTWDFSFVQAFQDGRPSFVVQFSGSASVQVNNLVPCCDPAAIIDPRIQDRLNKQANGGGCDGCGDGNNF